MEENLKQLLLKDLCARLPYGVMVLEDINKEFDGGYISKLTTITEIKGEKMFLTKNSLTPVTIEEIRPYLRPMSSMTEEERNEYFNIIKNTIDFYNCPKSEDTCFLIIPIDWLNAHHFDYRGLIPKDLAFEAKEGMYNLNK